MNRYTIQCYEDFVSAVLDAGFSMGGGNSEGIFALIPWNWKEEPPYDTPVRWHTGIAETDPWEWRMRVLDERSDIAYARLFFKKSGYITKAWYPYFLAVRRPEKSFDHAYQAGKISHDAKRIYQVIGENGPLPLHAIKPLAGFRGADKSKFDRALVELQMRMYITMCGRQQKLSKMGVEYGWSSTMFCLTERFFGDEVFAQAAELDPEAAAAAIARQIDRLNPGADAKKRARFIRG